ncbi:hypothetical protein SARC_01619 [Sphaeroforma arctica JP610]|uniref:O-fucosyltransferase family protein n=1 Tax=Sphaeroforma arctica JP610 TaxID=667725 RepID=A0A0L0GBF8_9EUKA|nr:hypothetical protein SARC_01619 [Sphaeroforma arctica JP610]KNC86244.1 hypothetical protein SARC_01619 [Sphaeroforma arctica JP610]|eukprot:XP_014160146.1 hypothetical protein SARC_01619 [Sphaeroforma arctica JP610]
MNGKSSMRKPNYSRCHTLLGTVIVCAFVYAYFQREMNSQLNQFLSKHNRQTQLGIRLKDLKVVHVKRPYNPETQDLTTANQGQNSVDSGDGEAEIDGTVTKQHLSDADVAVEHAGGQGNTVSGDEVESSGGGTSEDSDTGLRKRDKPTLAKAKFTTQADAPVSADWYSYHYTPQEEDKFLWFNSVSNGGLNDRVANMKSFVAMAVKLGRIPVLGNPPLHAERHNMGNVLPFDTWNTYMNMSKATYTWADENAEDVPIRFISERELFRDGKKIKSKIVVPGTTVELTDKQASAQVLELDTKKEEYTQYVRLPLYRSLMRGTKLRINMPPSDQVIALGRAIVRRGRGPSASAPFVTVHVRRGDRLADPRYNTDECQLDRDTQPESIVRRLSDLGIPAPASLYILTNEEDLHFFDPMEKAGYTIIREFDVPELVAVGQGTMRNNFLIYAAEKYAQSLADKDVHTFTYQGKNKPAAPVVGAISSCLGWT